MSGTYAILIDRGAVVGQGCSYDGPPTPGITSTSYWQFNPKGICGRGFSLAPPWFSSCEGKYGKYIIWHVTDRVPVNKCEVGIKKKEEGEVEVVKDGEREERGGESI